MATEMSEMESEGSANNPPDAVPDGLGSSSDFGIAGGPVENQL